jgi:membrane protein implicated in regulation of membrane protease activity
MSNTSGTEGTGLSLALSIAAALAMGGGGIWLIVSGGSRWFGAVFIAGSLLQLLNTIRRLRRAGHRQ